MQHSAALMLEADEAEKAGVIVNKPVYDYSRVIAFRQKVVDQLVGGVEFLLAKRKVEIYPGRGHLSANNRVLVRREHNDIEIGARKVILATGSRPSSFAGINIDNKQVLDSDGLLAMTAPPKSLVIIGAGAVGCEWAQIMHLFGVKITIVEALPRLLPAEDAEAGKLLERVFKKWGIAVHTGVPLDHVDTKPDGVAAHLGDEQVIEAEKLLLSVGRKPVYDTLWDEKLKLEKDAKGVKVTPGMETTVKGVYAIGDLAGPPLLAHKASAEGRIAVENALGGKAVMGYMIIPACTFTFPEVASVGINEDTAQKMGIPVRVGSFPFRANGRALSMGEMDGFVKLIAGAEQDVLLGGVIMGPHASDLIMEIAMGLKFGGDFRLMEQTVHPHPTLSEAVVEALADITGSAVHKIKL
jgi:dihydrolipoamide dehydrogenase